MNRVLLTTAVFISTIFLLNSGYASEPVDPTNLPSGHLRVNFHNATGYTCKSSGIHLKHGNWSHKPPGSVGPHKSDFWEGKQTYRGPDMALTFECGGYSFSVRNQQNFSWMEGGDQNNSTYSVNKHVKVTNKQFQHARTRNIMGIANITVSLNRSQLTLK
ncbi:hypothetical protein [Candidatus Sororendozoicomonas aggregata]|uniref:hypothetical protein n=1 Tax=Candidatus Sororendozoicomonas aggregata TaxID=3073239 RepID=UPI002ED32D00